MVVTNMNSKNQISLQPRTIVRGLLLLCAIFVSFLYLNNDIGEHKNLLESDIRSSQRIQDDWIVDGTVSDSVAAFISYPEDKSDHTYSVYVNRPGLSFGYFFRGGGSLTEVDKYVSEYRIQGYSERAFICMNEQKVARLEIDDGNTVQIIDMDSEYPFALVLPINIGIVTFYDVCGNVVEYITRLL